MTFSTWVLFSGLALVAVISPGPAVLLSITNSLAFGFRSSIYSSLGNIVGLFLVSGAAILGLGAVLKTSVLLFTVFKTIGAIYLIYLGIQQWCTKANIFQSTTQTIDTGKGKRKTFAQGFLVAISNPKAILFFTALFPQFLDLSKPLMAQFLLLTLTFMFFSFIILVFYAIGAESARDWFSVKDRSKWYNRISGMIFITFGLGVLRLNNKST